MKDLQLELIPQVPPSQEVTWLENYLNDHPGWHTAAAIIHALHGTDAKIHEVSDEQRRAIRALAQGSPWIISGQKGYKHIARATAEEIAHFTHWMESQAREMTRRAASVRQNAHKIFG